MSSFNFDINPINQRSLSTSTYQFSNNLSLDNLPPQPELKTAKSTPIYTKTNKKNLFQVNQLSNDDLSAYKIRKSILLNGQQVLSNKMLEQITENSDNIQIIQKGISKEKEEEEDGEEKDKEKEKKLNHINNPTSSSSNNDNDNNNGSNENIEKSGVDSNTPDKKGNLKSGSERKKTKLTLNDLLTILINEKEIIEPNYFTNIDNNNNNNNGNNLKSDNEKIEEKEVESQQNKEEKENETLTTTTTTTTTNENISNDQKISDFNNNENSLRCSCCYDDVIAPSSSSSLTNSSLSPEVEIAAYICSNSECSGVFCRNCLYRQVEVTITNALYAVPKIRCPGTCLGRIPTALWRGVLRQIPVSLSNTDSKDIPDHQPTQTLVQSLIAQYDTFSRNFNESYLDELSNIFDTIKEILASSNLRLTDVYNQAYDLNLIPPPEIPLNSESTSNSESTTTIPSRPFLNSFLEFANVVLPTTEPVFRTTNLFRTSQMTEQLDAYIQSDIASIATQSTDSSIFLTVFCFFLAELAICLRARDRIIPFTNHYENPLKSTAEVTLLKKYLDNAEGLMAMRCGSCHRTTGLNFSEKNNHHIITDVTERTTSLNQLISSLSRKTTIKLLKTWINFNDGKIPASVFAKLICKINNLISTNQTSLSVSETVNCPRGHPMTGINTFQSGSLFLPRCAASGEALRCTSQFHSENNTSVTFHRCTICSFHYCENCYQIRNRELTNLRNRINSINQNQNLNDNDDSDSDDDDNDNNKKDNDVKQSNEDKKEGENENESKESIPEPIEFNYEGIPTFRSYDSIHQLRNLHYCGRFVRDRYYQIPGRLACGRCNGICGPSSGCQCLGCAALDHTNSPTVENNGILSDLGWRYAEKFFSLILDPERRFVLQLEFMKQYPKIKTPCCNREHCFMCKVQGHHEGRTCDEVQRDTLGIECQCCPECGVPTVKTEGCSHIICPCGRHWQWNQEGTNLFGSSATSSLFGPSTTSAFGTGFGTRFGSSTNTGTGSSFSSSIASFGSSTGTGLSFGGAPATTSSFGSSAGTGFSFGGASGFGNSTNTGTGFGNTPATTSLSFGGGTGTNTLNSGNAGGFSFSNSSNTANNNSSTFGGFNSYSSNNTNNSTLGFPSSRNQVIASFSSNPTSSTAFSSTNNNSTPAFGNQFGTSSVTFPSNINPTSTGFHFHNNNNNTTGITSTGFRFAPNDSFNNFHRFNNNNNNNNNFNNGEGFRTGFGISNNNNNNNFNNFNNNRGAQGFGFRPEFSSNYYPTHPAMNHSSINQTNPFTNINPSTYLVTPGIYVFSTPYGIYQTYGLLPVSPNGF